VLSRYEFFYMSLPVSVLNLSLIFVKVENVIAYYHGSNQPVGPFPLATDHIHVDSGWGVPQLSGLFCSAAKVTSSIISMGAAHGNACPTYFLILCGQFDSEQPPTSIELCEIIVFRRGTIGDTLVNIQSNDLDQMTGIIAW